MPSSYHLCAAGRFAGAVVVLIAPFPFVLAQTPVPTVAAGRVVKQAARGVELIQETLPASDPNGPLVVSALRVDLKARGARVTLALGQDRVWGEDATKGREIVSSLAKRRGAVAGINAGFFPFAGNPLGIHIENGDLVTEPNRRASLTLDAKGNVRFARFTYAGTLRDGEAEAAFPIHGLNRPPGKGNELLLYTPRFFRATLPQAGRFEVVLRDVPGPLRPGKDITGIVARTQTGGGAPLEKDTLVLSGGGAGAEFLRSQAIPGARLRFRLDMDAEPMDSSEKPVDLSAVREAVAGGPGLLRGGRIALDWAEEGFPAAFARDRHPRTAVGLTRDRSALLLVAVDGRQSALSRGATLAETAAILLKLGAWDAINLDGGGSTALVVQGALVNSPSEGGERPVANALLVSAEPLEAAPRAPLTITSGGGPLRVGEMRAFALVDRTGRNLSGHPRTVWGTGGGVGFVTQNGVFQALRPGTGVVRATLGGRVVSVPQTVVSAPPDSP